MGGERFLRHTQNVLAVPIRDPSGEIVGGFEARNKRIGGFTPTDEDALDVLASHAANAIETARLVEELRRTQDGLAQQNSKLVREIEDRYHSHGILGAGPKIQKVVRLIERIRDSVVNVLITGESGSGKEMAAKAIHSTSPRARKPFLTLPCAAFSETCVEMELFGAEKSVFSEAKPRLGYFQQAQGGTLFLDEVGALPSRAQARILRVLEEQVDVRLLASTTKDLEVEIAKGSFRQDLYYRLKVIHIHVPPLREMRDEFSLLANHFLQQYCRETDHLMEFSPDVLRRFRSLPWAGNVRELRSEVARLAACAQAR